MNRSIAAYPFPDDDGRTLARLVSRLPDQARFDMTWRPTDDWLLTITPRWPKARSYQVIIPNRRRPMVHCSLMCLPVQSVAWQRVEAVEFGSSASRIAFEALI
jgi:hypothetical protein